MTAQRSRGILPPTITPCKALSVTDGPTEGSLPLSADAFLYQEAVRRVRDQRDQLTELRTRTGGLIFAATIATAFLGSTAAPGHHGIPGRFYWALAPFGVSVVLTLLLLAPIPVWKFYIEGQGLDGLKRAGGEVIRNYLTDLLRSAATSNQRWLTAMSVVFGIATFALMWSIVAWIYIIE